mmetsp:Transcript_15197/g.13737  ORF Transcript_15197/g.13737 Transcript_15197/m.13737 type:complete len:150 (+) Transcript_15197:974-1423(+)
MKTVITSDLSSQFTLFVFSNKSTPTIKNTGPVPAIGIFAQIGYQNADRINNKPHTIADNPVRAPDDIAIADSDDGITGPDPITEPKIVPIPHAKYNQRLLGAAPSSFSIPANDANDVDSPANKTSAIMNISNMHIHKDGLIKESKFNST